MTMCGLIIGLFGIDQYIKEQIEKQPEDYKKKKGKCTIRKCHNKGIMYSIGKENPEQVKLVSGMMFFFLFFKWIISRRKSRVERVSWALLVAGAMGNIWDRIKRGYVVDYIHMDCNVLRKIVFNFADVCIAIGGIMLLVKECLKRK